MASDKFSGFIIGKIVDSLIIGFLCFIGCSIIKIEYPVLIGLIIGVTNIIPFFGPIIGAIPCLLLLLIINPIHALYFLIFVIILQQLDGPLSFRTEALLQWKNKPAEKARPQWS